MCGAAADVLKKVDSLKRALKKEKTLVDYVRGEDGELTFPVLALDCDISNGTLYVQYSTGLEMTYSTAACTVGDGLVFDSEDIYFGKATHELVIERS